MNLRMDLKIVRPYNTASTMERMLSSRMTTSPLSLATSAPLPMAKDTSALRRAGLSLTPSPVIPTTRPSRCPHSTSLTLSAGRARVTTLSVGRRAASSLSDNCLICSLVITASRASLLLLLLLRSSGNSPTSLATAVAVSVRSPVTITTWMPALCASSMLARASSRTVSLTANAPRKTRLVPASWKGCPGVIACVVVATDRTRAPAALAWSMVAKTCCRCWSVMGTTTPAPPPAELLLLKS
mmetsp:Transcript_29877/g.58554  ORF Transcript_29877/g.58554 Transcript_29877/m.58554 type:complete len:241 (+) Transcript_29877:957-1679(+)